MKSVNIRCASCRVVFTRSVGRVNEAEKLGWKQFCSPGCLVRSKMHGALLVCSSPQCKRKFYRGQSQITKVRRSFCSRSCAAVFNNEERSSRLEVKVCAHPSCSIRISRSEDKKYCSFAHWINQRKIPINRYKEKVIAQIKTFYKSHGRIPVKRELAGMYVTARNLFGTWNKAIEAAGFKPNPILFAERHIASDGHPCDSLAEKVIDDWLSMHRVAHQRNVHYPNSLYTADFLIGGKFIEFFGLNGQLDDYDKIVQKKKRLAKKNKLPLIELYPRDLFPRNRLAEILEI